MKRKASDTSDKLQKKSINQTKPSAIDDAVANEHRAFLLTAAGATKEEIEAPVTKTRKSTAKFPASSEVSETHTNESGQPSTAPTTPSELQPGLETPQSKTKKRKVTAPASSEYESPLQSSATPSPKQSVKKQSVLSKKRKVAGAPAESPPSAHDSGIVVDNVIKGTDEPLLPPKRIRRSTAKAIRSTTKLNVKEANVKVFKAPLSFIAAAKVQRSLEHLATRSKNNSALSRDPDKASIVTLPKRTLLGALHRICVDYEVGSPEDIHLAELEDMVVERFAAPLLQRPDQLWIKLDLAIQPTEGLLHEASAKVAGYGLQGINLLEMELEMMSKEAKAREGLWTLLEHAVVSAPHNLQASFDSRYEAVRFRGRVA
ncbi:hypothetical protein LTR62_004460 [Meristemomyces frigidus]|uniref:Uncharacterized protein n=1 Tax=Meristemomyces frigidus TaxID=1508187 RepID=A0AAN7YP51_9PEZI|nr:hypothetical protein LTR62_004460 [Meristemomyces frigidus]